MATSTKSQDFLSGYDIGRQQALEQLLCWARMHGLASAVELAAEEVNAINPNAHAAYWMEKIASGGLS